MGKDSTVFVCTECGLSYSKWMGRCSGCGAWNSLVEQRVSKGKRELRASTKVKPVSLSEIDLDKDKRLSSGLEEIDRVLGGGMVPGALVLLGGEPGIGKSTLLLQVLIGLGDTMGPVLYVTGEESLAQIRMRADRILQKGLGNQESEAPQGLLVVAESSVEVITSLVDQIVPNVLAVDSVQTLLCPEIPSAPGSIAQVRESALRLMELSKDRGITTFLVGHVTKEGSIAGPRVLEHLVDTVLYFEGDRSHSFRLLRTVKNRFGPTNEIGVFEMTEAGLVQVPNPSEVFLSQRPRGLPGSVVVPCLEGTRPILAEIQALVSPSHLTMPRRTATGIDSSRLALLIAVMERYLGITLYDRDIFVNVTGGLKITEPGADLAIALAIVSSFGSKPLDADTAVIGEVGLTGEVRPVSRIEVRLKEAKRLGMKRCIIPASFKKGLLIPEGLQTLPVGRIKQAVELLG